MSELVKVSVVRVCMCLWSSRLQELVVIVSLHGLRRDALVLFEQAADGVAQRSVQTALAVKRVRLTLCS